MGTVVEVEMPVIDGDQLAVCQDEVVIMLREYWWPVVGRAGSEVPPLCGRKCWVSRRRGQSLNVGLSSVRHWPGV